MFTKEDNDRLTQVGPGTPCGELFRRYWQPVGIPPELTDETPTKHVRILGEDLVLFRDRRGRVGLLADHCSHRGASLLYGRVEERGIACAYHGWLYDVEGNCLETPAEPADSQLFRTIKHKAYPAQELYGLYWAYLGPAPAPVLPRLDLMHVGPVTSVKVVPQMDCNWLQTVENNMDWAHVFILHQNVSHFGASGSTTANSTRGFIDDTLEAYDYSEVPFGIKRRKVHQNGYDVADLMIFPNAQRIFSWYSSKVPIDDTHTRMYSIYPDLGLKNADGQEGRDGSNAGIQYFEEVSTEAKDRSDAIHPVAKYRMDKLRFQDFTIMETQGAISARENWHLATSDRGVVLLRDLLQREIEKVQQGLDPIGVIRDPEQDCVDTYIENYIDMSRRFPSTYFA